MQLKKKTEKVSENIIVSFSINKKDNWRKLN